MYGIFGIATARFRMLWHPVIDKADLVVCVRWTIVIPDTSFMQRSKLAYVGYVRAPIFIDLCINLDMGALTRRLIFFPMIFLSFQKLSGSYNFIPVEPLLLYVWPLSYLFLLGRERFFTVYICFKKPFFSIFHTNYWINISHYLRTFAANRK